MEAWLETYLSLTQAERAEMIRKESAAINQSIIESVLDEMDWYDSFIKSTKRYLQDYVNSWKNGAEDISEDQLKSTLKLCAESIELSEKGIKICRKEIAHWTKYPIGTIKRRDYFRTLKQGESKCY